MQSALLYELVLEDLPKNLIVGRKKYPLSGQAFYQSVHYTVRKKLVQYGKLYISYMMDEHPELSDHHRFEFILSTKRKIGPKTKYHLIVTGKQASSLL